MLSIKKKEEEEKEYFMMLLGVEIKNRLDCILDKSISMIRKHKKLG
jgi:hypothetical protein